MSNYMLYDWLAGSPAVLFHTGSNEDHIGVHLPNEKIYRFVIHMWHLSADSIALLHRQWTERNPKHHIVHLANDFSIGRQLQSRGIPVIMANQNCLLDEAVYTIQPNVEKKFDAVYTARAAQYKRRELLSGVSSSLIIGPVGQSQDSLEPPNLKELLSNTVFTHSGDNDDLKESEVATALNSARVGVCLSAVEGTMFAATEYLLCGLPVVSTPSLGGRDTWFDTRFTRIVPADPAAIAAAVSELSEQNISPEFIRSETLHRMTEQRREIIKAGQAIYTAEHSGRDFARDFYRVFKNRFGTWRLANQVFDRRP